MAKVLYDVMAKTGTYTDNTGQEKSRWQKCGVVFNGEKGPSLKLECLPVGEWNGWFSLFEPKPKDERQPAREAPRSNDDDDPPF